MFFPSHSFIRCHNSCSPRAYCRALGLSSVFKSTKFASTPHDPGFKPAHMAGSELLSVTLAAGTDFVMTTALLRDSFTLFSSSCSHGMVCHAKFLGWRAQGRTEQTRQNGGLLNITCLSWCQPSPVPDVALQLHSQNRPSSPCVLMDGIRLHQKSSRR